MPGQEVSGKRNGGGVGNISLIRVTLPERHSLRSGLELGSAQDILSRDLQFPSKSNRSRFRDVVHAFRKAHGFDPTSNGHNEGYPSNYRDQLEEYGKLLSKVPDLEQDAIRRLSEPKTIMGIEGAGRMRRHGGSVDIEVAKALSPEVRAAFIWRALGDFDLLER